MFVNNWGSRSDASINSSPIEWGAAPHHGHPKMRPVYDMAFRSSKTNFSEREAAAVGTRLSRLQRLRLRAGRSASWEDQFISRNHARTRDGGRLHIRVTESVAGVMICKSVTTTRIKTYVQRFCFFRPGLRPVCSVCEAVCCEGVRPIGLGRVVPVCEPLRMVRGPDCGVCILY